MSRAAPASAAGVHLMHQQSKKRPVSRQEVAAFDPHITIESMERIIKSSSAVENLVTNLVGQKLGQEEKPAKPTPVDSKCFQNFIYCTIMLNALTLGLQADLQTGGWTLVWFILENIFTTIFAAEMVIKIYFLQMGYFWNAKPRRPQYWNLLDFVIALLAIVDCWILTYQANADAPAIRVMQLLRIIRIAKLLRLRQELVAIIEGLFSSLQCMVWIGFLLLIVIYGFSIVCRNVMGNLTNSDFEDMINNEMYFGSLPRTMLTLFNICLIDSWGAIIWPQMLYNPWMVIPLVVFMSVTCFGHIVSGQNYFMSAVLPWFRVHIVVLNDPGRLISSHIMHTALVAGWSALMLLYELITIDPTDPVYNPIWRQAAYTLPFASRIGVVRSLFDWSLGIDPTSNLIWTYETVSIAHILLSGLLILASFWHWAYWDLDLFFASTLTLDLNRIFGIHLTLASSLCLGFGLAHLTGFFGPGMWTSDSLNLVGSIRFVKASFNLLAYARLAYGVIPSHHIISGLLGIFVGLWHITSRPLAYLYNLLSMGKIESVLSSSIAAVFFAAFLTSALMWYGSAHTTQELFGPTRYSWDNAYYSLDIRTSRSNAWNTLPDKLVLYDYIGSNPAKGGLFRSGPMLKADGLVQNWLGHACFSMGTLSLSIRRMPAFFETFPVILIDQTGTVRADIAFRRSTSTYSVEESQVQVYFSGGCLNGTEYSTPSLVKAYARKAQFGQIFTFDKKTSRLTDGVFRTSARGWYSFSHITLAFLFFFGHLWHAGRAIFRDIWTGVTFESQAKQEYGRNEKLGDKTSSTKTTL